MKAIRAVSIVLALAPLTALDVRPAASEIYRPWCAQYYGGRDGARNCGFTSYQQCMMTATPGSGAFCVQNPWYLAYGSGQANGPIGRDTDHAARGASAFRAQASARVPRMRTLSRRRAAWSQMSRSVQKRPRQRRAICRR
jgi:hypothetical protein